MNLETLTELANKLYNTHMNLATVGAILRDEYQIGSVKAMFNKKLAQIVNTRINPEVLPHMKKIVKITEHLKRYKDLKARIRLHNLTFRLKKIIKKRKVMTQWSLKENDFILGKNRLY